MNHFSLRGFNTVLTAMLVALYFSWWLAVGAPRDTLTVVLLVIAAAPLLALLPGLWRGARFATALAGLVIPFHFAYAAMELIANPAVRGWVAAQTFLSLLLFATVMATLRQIRSPA